MGRAKTKPRRPHKIDMDNLQVYTGPLYGNALVVIGPDWARLDVAQARRLRNWITRYSAWVEAQSAD